MSRRGPTHGRMLGTSKVARRLGVLASALVFAGLATSACGTSGEAADRSGSASGSLAAAPTSTTTTVPTTKSTTTTVPTTTSTTLASCGATRDPFDPTNAGPPAGSPAVC